MAVKLLSYITILLGLCQMFHEAATEHCSGREDSISDMMLRGHIYRKITGAPLGDVCLRECYRDDRCQSFNYVIWQDMCELNNRTREARPEDFVPNSDRYYFKRDCGRVPLGSIPELPAESCKEIKVSEGRQVVSGKYWFDSIIPGKTVRAHCDMKKEDVDECSASISVCDVNANCQNTLGCYRCSCKPGFTGNGKTCIDIDECSASISVCDVNANCQNTRGSYRCSCKAGFIGNGKTCRRPVKNCGELHKSGKRSSGVYSINPDGSGAFGVFCDQTTAGGGWTVFQKRLDGSVDFYLGLAHYKRGFGNLNGEFWLGLDKIHRLTSSGQYKLRVDLENMSGNTAYAEYDLFAVGSEGTKYQLSVGSYTGTAGDSLASHNGSSFTTKDSGGCAVTYKGAWWYYNCYSSNLNGVYRHGQYSGTDSVRWYGFLSYSAKRAEMKMRPVDF